MYCITVYAHKGEKNAGKCVVLLYMLRWDSKMQVIVPYSVYAQGKSKIQVTVLLRMLWGREKRKYMYYITVYAW